MATSQNGWRVRESAGDARLVRLGGFPGSVLDTIRPIFDYLVSEFARRVEPIEGPVRDDWGYSYRPIAGTSIISNHASGTAVDLNALRHPQGRRGTFTDAQVREIRAILSELDDVIQWGGDWDARPDEMHFEVRRSASEEKVLDVARRLTNDTATRATGTITVQAGDGWWQTARRAGVGMSELLAANNATVATPLHPGDVLRAPDSATQVKGAPRSSAATHNGLLIRYHTFNEDLPQKRGAVVFLHGDRVNTETYDASAQHIVDMAKAARDAGYVFVVPTSPRKTWWLADGERSGMRVVAPQLQALRTFIPAVVHEAGAPAGKTVLVGHSGGAEAIAEHLARTDVAWAGGALPALLIGGGTPNSAAPIDVPDAHRKASPMVWAGSADGDGLGATTQNAGQWSAWASAQAGERAYRAAGFRTRLDDTGASSHTSYAFGRLVADFLQEVG